MELLERFLCQKFTNLLVSWFLAATFTTNLPNWKTREQQMPAEPLSTAVFREGHQNSELYFTPSFIGSSEDMEIMLGVTVLTF